MNFCHIQSIASISLPYISYFLYVLYIPSIPNGTKEIRCRKTTTISLMFVQSRRPRDICSSIGRRHAISLSNRISVSTRVSRAYLRRIKPRQYRVTQRRETMSKPAKILHDQSNKLIDELVHHTSSITQP